MPTPEDVQRTGTLNTAVARYSDLRLREMLAGDGGPPLSRDEALELLALGEGIARMAAYGRQLDVRSARAAGASWSQIGDALGTTKQAAWEAHTRWIETQSALHDRLPTEGFDDGEASAARHLAAGPDA